MNNINRENYETFFLLYIDNELSAIEKRQVDEFVNANPDLQEELVMLQQSTLKPDPIIFNHKHSLLKQEGPAASIQEKLLLLLDKELTETEAQEMNELVVSDQEINKEWLLLQQTKLPAEKILFKNKASLYRKEGGRIIVFPWRKLAVAAVLVGLGLWAGVTYLKNDSTVTIDPVVITNAPSKKIPADKIVDKKEVAPALPSNAEDKDLAATEKNLKEKKSAVTIKDPLPAKIINRNKKDDIAIEAAPKDNQLPKPYFENVNNQGSNKNIAANVTPEKQSKSIVNPGNNVNDNNGPQDAANLYASRTSLTEDSENNNRVLYFEEEKIKKTKLGGIFRKVKRVFERNTNLKSGGNNIKVANLEFAIQ